MRLSSSGSAMRVWFTVLLCSLILILMLNACGGGGGSSSPINPDLVTVSGTITYDFVPYNADFIGLDYSAIEVRPVRGAVVELLDSADNLVATTSTNDEGFYSARVEANTVLRVQVNAQLKRNQAPTWDMTVNDNTANNRLYALMGSEASVGNSNSQRNLHAPSGWFEGNYASSRPAGPFAILDAVYASLQQFVIAGYNGNFPPLQLR